MSRAEESSVTKTELDNDLVPAERRLDRIVFIGRTYDEYMRLFDLSEGAIAGRNILDCPAGACSFTAQAGKLGCHVTAADIAYYHDHEKLAAKGIQDIVHAMEHVETEKDRYHWTEFRDVEDLRAERTKALQECTKDMRIHPDRYVPVTLPSLPFKAGQFDLTLSAHFMFTYADRLDAEFHESTLRELFRVTREEVRIFPLVDQSGRRSEHVDHLIMFAHGERWVAEIKAVPYLFQRNADQVLIFRKGL
ncbi:SAM-dependent methyltransferase [Paenibacillus sp.]|jgi:hypothetical protein|uniref:SAM-dependent methyltransferase n=1 Tax=Paenibacillus sp. TaxID=58172 RepID=UPI002830A5A7|nr:SAM-dependent methyltransferase [Paenibacillus sp.]MDR0270706.1 SAM-dependent methyltransferase [Paenibacillus sp.]